MELTILNIIIIMVAFLAGFIVAFFVIRNSELDETTTSNHPDMYCFECEWEMPVKEKNGRISCSNCGLSHGKL